MIRRLGELASKRIINQLNALFAAIKRKERSHTRPLGLAKKHLIKTFKPIAQIFIFSRFARGINNRLDILGTAVIGKRHKL